MTLMSWWFLFKCWAEGLGPILPAGGPALPEVWEIVSLAPWNPFAWFASTRWPGIEFSLGFSDGALSCPRDPNWWAERAATSHAAPRLLCSCGALFEVARELNARACSCIGRKPWRRLSLEHSFAWLARGR